MTFRRTRWPLLALALLAAPADLTAQAAPRAQPDSVREKQVQALVAELEDVTSRIEALQERALRDPELADRQEALGARIKSAMEEIDPTLPESLARVDDLSARAALAAEKGDSSILRQLGTELELIQVQFLSARQQALDRPDLAEAVEGFQYRLRLKMIDLEPGAPALLERYEELQVRLVAAMR